MKPAISWRNRIIKAFLDIIILSELLNNEKFSGYDIIINLRKKHSVHYSPSSIYHILSKMENYGWITSKNTSKKKVYFITDKGKQKVKVSLIKTENISEIIRAIFKT